MDKINNQILDIILSFFIIISILVGKSILFKNNYYYNANDYFYVLIILSGITIFHSVLNLKKKDSKFNLISFALFFVFSCFIVDAIYGISNFKISIKSSNIFFVKNLKDINSYFIDRSYQYFAVIFFIIIFVLKGFYKKSMLKAGNINTKTFFLGKNKESNWKIISVKISLLLLIGALTIMYFHFSYEKLLILPAKIIGGINNSIIEELLFRGIYFSILLSIMQYKFANQFQALFFSYVHIHWFIWSNNIVISNILIKFFLYYVIGWFFGKITKETGGILTSSLLHSAITVCIWISLPQFT